MPKTSPVSSVDPSEVEKFAKLAEQWWDPAGSFAPLHKFNPIRLRFIRDTAARHFSRAATTSRPFDRLSLLDLGCGGGLLSEPMARLGFRVTGCDAAVENIRAATAHAGLSSLEIAYHAASAEALAVKGLSFDVVLNMEVVEHVADIRKFIMVSAGLVRPGGLMFIATINRTLKSLALAKIAAEYVLRWLPAGTHDWNRFVEPEKLHTMLEEAGLRVLTTQGMVFDPLSWDWRLSRDTDVNFIVAAERTAR